MVHPDRLKDIPIFAELEDSALEGIATAANEFECAPGHVLIQPNTAGSGLFVIEDGTVTIETGHRVLERGAGEFVGELSLLSDRARSARVKAKTAVKGLAISRFDFSRILESEPSVALKILEVVATRLADSIHPDH